MNQLYQCSEKKTKVDLQADVCQTNLCKENNIDSKSYYAKIIWYHPNPIIRNKLEKCKYPWLFN